MKHSSATDGMIHCTAIIKMIIFFKTCLYLKKSVRRFELISVQSWREIQYIHADLTLTGEQAHPSAHTAAVEPLVVNFSFLWRLQSTGVHFVYCSPVYCSPVCYPPQPQCSHPSEQPDGRSAFCLLNPPLRLGRLSLLVLPLEDRNEYELLSCPPGRYIALQEICFSRRCPCLLSSP